MPYVDTTFLPKTNGMVFDPRLQARANKGRVFGLASALEPEVTIVADLTSPVTVTSGQRNTFSVLATGNYTLSFTWQIRKADDTGWVPATQANLDVQYPGAEVLLLDVQDNVFNYTWVSGLSFPKLRCRIKDTAPDGTFNQVNSTTVNLNY